MDVDELIAKGWSAVEKAGIPEPLQGVALKEAIDFLRGGDGSASASGGSSSGPRKKGGSNTRKSKPSASSGDTVLTNVDEAEFFSNLASESGVDESRLRDCLQLTTEGSVHVTPPTRDLGGSVRAQALVVVALVASARSRGLGENPVAAEAVHAELKRKHCWDGNNFSKHLGSMKGFNAGSKRTEIVVTSKWLDEFKAAVDSALGDNSQDG